MEELEVELEPFCYTAGLKFETCDERVGHWRNFFIGIIGSVDAQEEDVLWPNQVSHSTSRLRLLLAWHVNARHVRSASCVAQAV